MQQAPEPDTFDLGEKRKKKKKKKPEIGDDIKIVGTDHPQY